MSETKELSLNAIKHQLKHHCGTSQYYMHWYQKKALRTDGTKEYCGLAKCEWLWDVIATELYPLLKNINVLDKFYLTCTTTEESKMNIVLKDYKDNEMYTRKIDWTSHPEGEMLTYVAWNGDHLIWCIPEED